LNLWNGQTSLSSIT